MRKLFALLTVGVLAAGLVLAGCGEGFPDTAPPSGNLKINNGASNKAAFNNPTKGQYTFPDSLITDASEDGAEEP